MNENWKHMKPEDFRSESIWQEILERDEIDPLSARKVLALLFFHEGGNKRYIPKYADATKAAAQRS